MFFIFFLYIELHELSILVINPFLVTSSANIFHSKSCLFILLMVFFAMQKILSLIRPHLFIFVFIFIILGGELKKILLWLMSESVLPMFYTKGFTVSGLRVTSLIHFEFILCDVRVYFNFSLLHVTAQFSQHHLSKRLSFLYCIFLPTLSWVRWP